MADPQPGQVQRPEQTTTFSTPSFTRPEYALDANHQMAKEAFAQRQAQAPELHRQALESARSAPQPGEQQARAMHAQPDREDARMYPESAVHAGIETAVRSALGRGRPEPAEPRPARATGPVFGGRDLDTNMTSLATEL